MMSTTKYELLTTLKYKNAMILVFQPNLHINFVFCMSMIYVSWKKIIFAKLHSEVLKIVFFFSSCV